MPKLYMNDKVDRIKEWFYQADQDLGSAIVIFQHIPRYFETVAFHCQQAVEKYIKGLLVFYDSNFKKTHDVVFLLELLTDKTDISDDLYSKALSMEGFGVDIRYPNHKIHLSKEELENTIKIAREFRAFVKERIDFNLDEYKLPGS